MGNWKICFTFAPTDDTQAQILKIIANNNHNSQNTDETFCKMGTTTTNLVERGDNLSFGCRENTHKHTHTPHTEKLPVE